MDSFSTGNLRWSNTAERITSNMHATSFQIAIDRQVCIAAQGVSLISVRELDAPGPIRSRFLAPNSAAGPFRAVWRFHHTRCDVLWFPGVRLRVTVPVSANVKIGFVG